MVISSLSCGGAERVMSVMANYWSQRGETVTIITIDSKDLDFYPLHPGVKRIALGLSRPSYGLWSALQNNIIRVYRLRMAIQAVQSGVVISFLYPTNVLTLIASLGLRVPVIVSEHTDPAQNNMGVLFSILRRMMYPLANTVVVLTEKLRSWAEHVAKYNNVCVIPNPVSLSIPDNKCGPPSSKDQNFKVLAMGRLASEKSFDLLIRAFAKVAPAYPDWRLIILGEGERRSDLEGLARDLRIKDRVEMPGRIKEPLSHLMDADLFVLSSRYEGFPMALLEAMACGLPVISFDCPIGPREIIRDGIDGILVPPDDVDALASAMDKLMKNPTERQSLGLRALEVQERFSLEKIMGMWDRVLVDMMRNR